MAVRTNPAGIRQLFSESGGVGRYLSRLGSRVEQGAQRRAPQDTGELSRSFQKRFALRGNEAVVTVSNTAPYALFVHEGTRPHFPPSNALGPWASRHGFPASSGGFLVARAISRRGTPGVPFLKDALDDIKGG